MLGRELRRASCAGLLSGRLLGKEKARTGPESDTRLKIQIGASLPAAIATAAIAATVAATVATTVAAATLVVAGLGL